jgi:hypothetical protein
LITGINAHPFKRDSSIEQKKTQKTSRNTLANLEVIVTHMKEKDAHDETSHQRVVNQAAQHSDQEEGWRGQTKQTNVSP